MSFISGIIVGGLVGIGLILAFTYAERRRQKLRSELTNTVAAFARMTVQDSRKLLPSEAYPSWVVFSQRQKLDWLNQQLDKIWPYVNEAASELIRNNVESILEEHRPLFLASLKFSKLTLGTVAPQFTGIEIIGSESGAGGITLELDVQWDGNPNIVLDVKTRVGVALPIQVKDLGFTGVFRIILKPLVDEFPCFGAIAYSLREKKKMDFTLKVIGGDISSIPGVSNAIEETIMDAVEDSITWPVRNIIPILPGDYSDLELKPVGTLDVKLIQAKELTNKDVIGKSDPFAVLFIRPLRDKMKTSKTIDNQLNPVWNEHYEFEVEDPATQNLSVRIFDDEGVQEAESIGVAQLPLKELQPGKVKDVWLKLLKDLQVQRDNKNRGQVHLEVMYIPFSGKGSSDSPFTQDYSLNSLEKALKSEGTMGNANLSKMSTQKRKDVILRGVLSIVVISADNLPPVDMNGKADPYVVLTMKKSSKKYKTRVQNETLNPVWSQTFDFVVEDALHDMLILDVYDHDTFGKEKIGRVIMTLTRVLNEEEFQDSFPLDVAKSGKLNVSLKWSPQPIFRDS